MYSRRPDQPRKGSVLVEFALVALALIFILAATIDFGRAVYSAQIIQQAADVGARELARIPLPATMTFEEALQNPQVQSQVYNDNLLVVQLPAGMDLLTYSQTNNWPVINQLLVPLMIVDQNGLAQYPGVMNTPRSPTGRYQVPIQLQGGTSAVNLVPVVQEISPNDSDPNAGPFSLTPTATPGAPPPLSGYVALRINFPFQAGMMVAYQQVPNGNGGFTNVPVEVPPGEAGGPVGPYGGSDGMGNLLANTKNVRPFRRLLSAQAIYRREVFSD